MGLDDGMRGSRVELLPHELLYLQCFKRTMPLRDLPLAPAYLKVDGCHKSCALPCCLQYRADEIAGSSLSVIACDTNGAEALCWVMVESAREIRQRGSYVSNLYIC